MTRYILWISLLFLVANPFSGKGQQAAQTDTVRLNLSKIEELFLKQNLPLLVEKLNIDIADATITQTKLWANPNFSVNQVNFWSRGEGTEYAVALEQLISTAGKRHNLVAMQKVSKDIATQYFEELLRELKLELRQSVQELIYLESYQHVLAAQQLVLDKLINTYQTQVAQGNVSRSQLVRLQASLLDNQSEINDLQKDINERQRALKVLLGMSYPTYLTIENGEPDAGYKNPTDLAYGRLIEMANSSRPDLKAAIFQVDYAEKSLKYEKAQRVPNFTIGASYDRAGGYVPNFIGLGISMDLPFFDRNQGNIKAAAIRRSQSRLQANQQVLTIQTEVAKALQNFTLSYNFYHQLNSKYINDLDNMLDSYRKNFISRNIDVVEFLDFFDAYKSNKKTALMAQKELKNSFEELQYAIGTEIK